jgi:hypothetical protein
MAGSAMLSTRRRPFSKILLGAPLLLLAATWPAAASANALTVHHFFQNWQQGVSGSSNPEASLPVFEMHSGFWVNLHHFLYLQARLLKNNSSAPESGRGAAQPDELPVSLNGFPEAEIHAWQDAVAFYSKDLANRDLLLNGDMEIINSQLATMETCPDLDGKTTPLCKSGLRRDLVEALERAAPVYRGHWWAQQDRANREWIAQETTLIRKLGVELAGQLADVYERPWPAQRVRVDVVWYAGPFGAYTTLDPIHVTVSSQDPRNRALYGFEVLFHEASHTLAGAVNSAIAREFRARDKPIPRDFWHSLLFYTTGEILRRDVEYGTMTLTEEQRSGPAAYLPYAARFGFYSGSWEHFHALLDLYWLPYLDGRLSFDSAIARIAADM